MAERRMFAKSIVNSAKFLKMPLSSIGLYFLLGCNADDDGVVEAYNVFKYCGASEDDLKILVLKGFVVILDQDDWVSYIANWNIHNKIRADRKTDSIYKDLLLKIVPDVEIVVPRKRSDLNKKFIGQSLDSPRADNGLLRIGKDRIGKYSIGEDNKDNKNDAQPISDTDIHDIFNRYFDRTPTKNDIDVCIRLCNSYSFTLVDYAFGEASLHDRKTVNYVIGVLRNLNSQGVKDMESLAEKHVKRMLSKT